MNSIGDKIKYYREKSNISKSQLAQLIDVSSAYVTMLENGKKKNPSFALINKVAKVLDVPLRELLTDKETNKAYDKATALTDTYYNSILKWSDNRILSKEESTIIREHFQELLLRYKKLINSTCECKSAWNKEKDAYIRLYKNKLSEEEIKELFLKQELEKEIKDLVDWIESFTYYFSKKS